MRPYVLAPHVRARVSDHGAVLLDLNRGTYIGLDPDQARLLCSVVEGMDHSARAPSPSRSAHDLAHSLSERGMLQVAGASKGSSPVRVCPADFELVPWDEMSPRAVRPAAVLAFMRALLTACVLLRCCSFARIVRRVEARKARKTRAGAHFDIQAARKAISAYVHIRLFVFAPKARCLFDSVAMLEYLAQYDLYPDWIVGVQINPFASHSWLQHERFVLNGTPHYVRAYEPILVT